MLTRRQMLMTGVAAGLALRSDRLFAKSDNMFVKAGQPKTKVSFAVPAGACDNHVHIHDPVQFPYSPKRVYTPEPALPGELNAMHKALGIDRVVIVTPSLYGTDNSATRSGIKARGNNARGIAVIDDKTTDAELDALHRDGFRGIRVNLASAGTTDVGLARKRLETAIARLKGRPEWHVEMFADLSVFRAVKDIAMQSSVPLVFDHFAGATAAGGPGQEGFSDILDLLRSSRSYVTMSGAYRASVKEPDYVDVMPLAKALIETRPDRLLWGSDWPHPHAVLWAPGLKNTPHDDKHDPLAPEPYYALDDGILLNVLAQWAPDAAVRKAILVDNPQMLYGF